MRALAVIVLLSLIVLPSAQAATETQISQSALDPVPYRFSTAVASSGNGYLVAWGATVTSSLDVFKDARMTIYVRAVGADGTPTQPFATAVGTGQRPSIAWNGHEYLVVWGITSPTTGSLPTPSVVGIRVREDGTLIDSAPVTVIAEVNPFSYETSCVWSGSQYMVTWIRGVALVDADLHAKLVLLSAGAPLYSASSGGDFLVLPAIFSSGPGGTKQSLFLDPVSSTGNIGTPIHLNGPHAGIAGTDGGYALIWDDNSNLRSARLRADGTMVSTSTLYLGHANFPALAARDGRIVAAWQTNQFSICAARIDTASQPLCSNRVQHDPAIGIASNSVLVAWSDRSDEGDAIRVAVSSSGDAPQTDSNLGRVISDPLPSVPAAERRVDGALTVAWTEYSQFTKQFEVHLGGIDSKGARLDDRVVFATALDQGSPVITAGAGRTMILWTEGAEPKIRMTIVDDLSGALIATLPLPPGVAPSAAFDGKEWIVTWQSGAESPVVRFAIVNSDGFVLSSGAVPATSTASPAQSAPAAAWSGKAFFLTWLESAAPGQTAANRVQLSTINAAGVPSAPVTLDSADVLPGSPSIASNGGHVLVSWGRPVNTLRQALFDSDGKQLGKFIDFDWPNALTRTRTHPMGTGFATLAGRRVAMTSTDGVGLDTIDIPLAISVGDFVVDLANRFTFIYSRLVGYASSANFAQTISLSLPRRRPQNH
ncbi:MAG TPA: hypothetical protein VN380_07860 [Thermoanaerobaculia bacterium]|nr:hypothetical protein [Thermoanaerobaculia bacterium]